MSGCMLDYMVPGSRLSRTKSHNYLAHDVKTGYMASTRYMMRITNLLKCNKVRHSHRKHYDVE